MITHPLDLAARLRPAKTQPTLRHLLTHTSGFCYDIWDGDMFRYRSSLKGPAPRVSPCA